MGKTLTDTLTLVSGLCWTLVYILIIVRSYQDKTYGMPYWALAFNFSWEFIFFLSPQYRFTRPAIATYHQPGMAGFRHFYFGCLFYVRQKGMVILCFALFFYSLFSVGAGYWLFLCLPDFGGTRSFKRKVRCLYSKPDDVLALHRHA